MTINVVSCLVLFPAVMLDLAGEAETKAASVTATAASLAVTMDAHVQTGSSGLMDTSGSLADLVKNETTSTSTSSPASNVVLCIWSTLSSSLVAHASVLAMMTVGIKL